VHEGVVTEKNWRDEGDGARRLNSARKLAKKSARAPSFPASAACGRAWAARSGLERHDRSQRESLRRIADRRPGAEDSPFTQAHACSARTPEMVKTGAGIDWGSGEMLAIGSLLLRRRAGAPSPARTSSAARSVTATPSARLQHGTCTSRCRTGPEAGEVHRSCNSMLSELAVLGTSGAFASADPRNLVIWEAQFGDFVNGAQPMIDQILASAESKWNYMNGLVMLLPTATRARAPSIPTRTSSGS
jgi:2-oxoglutarate dehydrogenase E1 component